MGRNAQALLHAAAVENNVLAQAAVLRADEDVVVNELKRVSVAGGEDCLHVFAAGHLGERAHDVVGLEPLALDDGNVKRAGDLAHEGDLAF